MKGDGEPSRIPGGVGVLALILAAHVVLFFLLHGNFAHDYDAPHYARIAHEMATGEHRLAPHPFSQRFAVTVPTAAVYRVLGVGALTTTLWPLVASLGTIVLVFLLARRLFDEPTALLAAFLLALDYVQARYASRLLPDVVVSAFMLAGLVLLTAARTEGRTGGRKARPVLLGFLCGLSLAAAFLAKSTLFWALPFFAAVFVTDLLKHRHLAFWTSFGLTGAGCAAVFFGAYHVATGDALYRLHAIESTHNLRPWTFADKPAAEVLRRVTYEPLRYLVGNPGYGLLLCLAAPALVHLVRPLRALPRGTPWVAGYMTVVLGSFWFGTTSTSGYNPLPIDERFLMPVLAPLCILAAVVVRSVWLGESRTDGRLPRSVLAAAAILCALATLGGGARRFVVYGGLAALAAALAVPPLARRVESRGLRGRATIAALVLLYLLPVAYYAERGEPGESPALVQLERALVHDRLSSPAEPIVVFTDAHSAFALPFLLGSAVPERVALVEWSGSWDPAEYAGRRRLVYVHQPSLIAMNLNWGQAIPDFAFDIPEDWGIVDRRTIDGEHWLLLCEPTPRDG